jgi:hypothetical protein
VPAVVVVTEVFANLAQTAARARGYERLEMLVLPHPMETRGRDEVIRIADAHAEELLRSLIELRPVSQFDADHS